MRGSAPSAAVAGLTGVPKCGLMPTPEKANSVRLVWPMSTPPARRRRATAGESAAAALRAAEQGLVHLVQARIGPDQFAYIAIARAKPRQSGGPALSVRLLQAA